MQSMGIRAIAPGPPVATVPNPVGPIHNFLQQHLEAVAHRTEAAFEPFVRLEGSRNRDTGGVGLGLAIARTIIQARGGAVQLRNLPAGGLEAEVRLPIGDA